MRRSKGGMGGYRGRRTLTDILKLIAIVLAAAVVLLAAGLFFGQRYIVYTDDGLRWERPFFQPQEETPGFDPGDINMVERPGASSGETEPDPDKTPEQEPEEPRMAAVQLPVESVVDGTALRQLEQAGANALVLEMKSAQGELSWASQEALAALAGVSAEDASINEKLRQWNAGDVYTIARVCCFRDNSLPYYCNRVALRTGSGNWRDEADMRHLDPTDTEAQAYIAGLCRELAELGFDEILLEHCAYPTRGRLERIVGSDGDPLTAIQAPGGFLDQVKQAVEPHGTLLSIRAERGMFTGEEPGSGLNAGGLEAYAQRIWVEGDASAPSMFELLSNAGITDAAERMVEIVPELVEQPGAAQAVLKE